MQPNIQVVCSQVGCGAAIAAPGRARFGPGYFDDPIWMDEVQCKGDEDRLQSCVFSGWREHDCQHYEDASVICHEGMQL